MDSPAGTENDSGALVAEKRSQPQSQIGYFSIPSSTSTDGRVTVGQDIEIFADKPRNDLESTETQAFDAKDRRSGSAQFALICRNSRVPRVTSIGSYKAIRSPYLLKLVEAGVIDWRPEGRQRLALVFEAPGGRRMIENMQARPLRIHEDRLIPALIMPVLTVLQEFRRLDMIHGAISLDNLFMTGSAGSESVVVGECLSTAAFFRLHPLYTTIERGMAQPSGRGQGSAKDDLYALGICVAQVVRGVNLAAGKTPEQVVAQKSSLGSLAFATGGERIPTLLGDFLRGVLNDDETERWDLDEAVRWAEGRRSNAKPQFVPARAARPFVFRDERYWDLRSIAAAFAHHPHEASQVLEKDQFAQWIKRNFEDKELEARLARAWDKEKGASRERIVAAICMALDPAAPLRYKDFSIFPTGLGVALAEAMSRQDEVQSHGEAIATQMFTTWIQLRFDEIADASSLITLFEKCRSFLVQKMPVYGIERVLYMLDKEVVCMSPLLLNYVVLGPGSLLLALEDIARQPDRPENILDRHMMAFISVREPKMIDPHLGHVISRDRGYHLIGVARTLAAIQRRFNTGPLPALGGWLVSMITPAVERYNDRELRVEMHRRLGKLTNDGNIAAILDLIDNHALVQDDLQRFALARREFGGLVRERTRLEQLLQRRSTFGRGSGRQVAMMMSVSLATLCIMGYLFLRLTGGA
ncbi:MAG TPA: hypothetical protein VEF76_01525 [Patescibacteria group bacterium]|nr:hypothetical protein [Patescibacteria group bacterium]